MVRVPSSHSSNPTLSTGQVDPGNGTSPEVPTITSAYGSIVPLSNLRLTHPIVSNIHISTISQPPRQLVNNASLSLEGSDNGPVTDYNHSFQSLSSALSPGPISPTSNNSYEHNDPFQYFNIDRQINDVSNNSINLNLTDNRLLRQIPNSISHSNQDEDGLDEIPPRHRTDIIQDINEFLDQRLNELRMIHNREFTSARSIMAERPSVELRRTISRDPSAAAIRTAASFSSVAARKSSSTKTKYVYELKCKTCVLDLSYRGMRAVLLANKKIELFSTDSPHPRNVVLLNREYMTSSCGCKLRDFACRACGTLNGYHVSHPCQKCLSAKHNGHIWMFNAQLIDARFRLDDNKEKVTWAVLIRDTKHFDPQDQNRLMREIHPTRPLQAYESICR